MQLGGSQALPAFRAASRAAVRAYPKFVDQNTLCLRVRNGHGAPAAAYAAQDELDSAVLSLLGTIMTASAKQRILSRAALTWTS